MTLTRLAASRILPFALLLAAGCATTGQYQRSREDRSEVGIASFYGPELHGGRTASGKLYDKRELTAAHRSLPFGTRVRVTNLGNGKTAVLTINDRGPFVRGRILDVSGRAAQELGFRRDGTARVRLDILQ